MHELIITIVVITPALTIILYVLLKRQRTKQRRGQLRRQALPAAWENVVTQRLPMYQSLPESLQQELQGLIQIFLDEKQFIGCEGLEITNEIRITIAAQACLLLLNRSTQYYPKLETIYVYPHAYVAKSVESDGTIVIEGESVRLGESWTDGPLVLSWDSVIGGARNTRDGHNVVLHEFAHQLDQEDGSADGAPILANHNCYRSWATILGKEYEKLCHRKKRRQRSILDKYGAANPAEFFAVATEAFFEKPKQMQKHCPDLYQELKSYYQLDPLNFASSTTV